MRVNSTKMLSIRGGRHYGTVVCITRLGVERPYIPSVHILDKLHGLLTRTSPKLFWVDLAPGDVHVKFKYTEGEVLPVLEEV